jgi:hypothetical protein
MKNKPLSADFSPQHSATAPVLISTPSPFKPKILLLAAFNVDSALEHPAVLEA